MEKISRSSLAESALPSTELHVQIAGKILLLFKGERVKVNHTHFSDAHREQSTQRSALKWVSYERPLR